MSNKPEQGIWTEDINGNVDLIKNSNDYFKDDHIFDHPFMPHHTEIRHTQKMLKIERYKNTDVGEHFFEQKS